MIKPTCSNLKRNLDQQLDEVFRVVEHDDQCIIVTPLMFPDNSFLTVSVEQVGNDRIAVSDEGEAAGYAFVNGVAERTIQDRVRLARRRFAIDGLGEDELRIEVGEDQLAEAIFMITGAMQDVGYLIYRQRQLRNRKTLGSRLENYLTIQRRSFSKDYVLPGLSGDRRFDYVIRGDDRQLLLDLFESTGKREAEKRAKEIAFDSEEVRSMTLDDGYPVAVLVDDTSRKAREAITDEVQAIFSKYRIDVLAWQDHESLTSLLQAA